MTYDTPQVTQEHDFLFDLRGYLLLEQALSLEQVAALNGAIDVLPPLEPQQWHGHVHRNDYAEAWGYNLQNIIEGGQPFEELIDHPGFLPWVQRYAGHDGLYIDEALVTIRRPGQGVSLHSGGHKRRVRTQYRVATGGSDGVSELEWRVGQLNVMVALTDVQPGDGGTMLIPGSHKSNLLNPGFTPEGREALGAGHDMSNVPAAVEIFMKAGCAPCHPFFFFQMNELGFIIDGQMLMCLTRPCAMAAPCRDVLLFVDSTAHGSAPRTNEEGERRFALYRYGPNWGSSRYGYVPSDALLERLAPHPQRYKIIQPLEPLLVHKQSASACDVRVRFDGLRVVGGARRPRRRRGLHPHPPLRSCERERERGGG